MLIDKCLLTDRAFNLSPPLKSQFLLGENQERALRSALDNELSLRQKILPPAYGFPVMSIELPTSPHRAKVYPALIPANLKEFGAKTYSQNDEDGIIAAIFSAIGVSSRFAVEFGIGPNYLDSVYANGLEGNTPLLRDQGWEVLLMDGGEHPPQLDVKRHFITASNINSLFREYNVPADVDLVSIDVDGQDYWIWKYLEWRPRVLVIEYNPNFHNIKQQLTVAYNEYHVWDGTRYYGASYGALVALGRQKGYIPVYANGTNLFFVQNELVLNPQEFNAQQMIVAFEMHAIDTKGRPWVVV
jgi:hypothetical protein